MGYQVAFVCEGITDTPILEAVVEAVLGSDFEPLYLQPERDMLSDGEGWGPGGDSRVRAWCEQRAHALAYAVPTADIVVVQLDADRCAMHSVSDTAGLCRVVKGWLGTSAEDDRLVIVLPAQASEAWLVAVLLSATPALEAVAHPANELAKLGHLVRDSDGRPVKDRDTYSRLAVDLRDGLTTARAVLPELDRFARKLEAQLRRLQRASIAGPG